MRDDLPTQVVEHRLAEDKRICECCGSTLHEMGCESRSEIRYIPARVEIVRHDTYKYGCWNCDQNGTSGNIIKAPAPAAVLPKSMASASLIAGIVEKKFMQGEPLYRQEKQFKRLGINLSRQTMSKRNQADRPTVSRTCGCTGLDWTVHTSCFTTTRPHEFRSMRGLSCPASPGTCRPMDMQATMTCPEFSK